MQIAIAAQPDWQPQIKMPSLPMLKSSWTAPLVALAVVATMIVITVVAVAPYQRAMVGSRVPLFQAPGVNQGTISGAPDDDLGPSSAWPPGKGMG
jgi:hypothetical protein